MSEQFLNGTSAHITSALPWYGRCLDAYFLGNMCAKHYENPTMLSRVTAKNVRDVFFETHCRLICTIAIGYSMGQIIKPVCVCSVNVSFSVSVYPPVRTLTVAFLDRFSPKLA